MSLFFANQVLVNLCFEKLSLPIFAMPLFDAENFPSLRSGNSSCPRLSMELFETINEFNSVQFFTAFKHSSVSALSEAISANKLFDKARFPSHQDCSTGFPRHCPRMNSFAASAQRFQPVRFYPIIGYV